MKVTVIGGGSYLWTMGFATQFVRSEALQEVTLSLMDIHEPALELVGRATEIFNRQHGTPLAIEKTTDLDAALDGADYVIVSIATGGLEAMEHDLKIPEKYGIWHTVGDTVGPGGWSRAVRNVPVFAHFAQRMKELCPAAWMINVSNPLTVLTRTPTKTQGIKCIGMCPGVHHHAVTMAELAGFRDWKELNYTATGIDHGSFLTALDVDGVDVIARLKERGYYREDGLLPSEVETSDPMAGTASSRAIFAIWRQLGYLPGLNDRHIVENFPWFLAQAREEDIPFQQRRTSIEERRQGKAAKEAEFKRYLETEDETSFSGFGHGDDPIVAVIEALEGHRSFLFGSNYRNLGQIPQLPADAVVETRVRFDGAGVHPLASPLPELLVPYVLPIVLRQETIIDIVLGGTFDELVALVAGDPLCSRLPLGACRRMMQELTAANRPWIQNPRLLE